MDLTAIKKNRFVHKYFRFSFLGSVAWKIIRAIILIGLCYIILYPFLVKITAAFMSEKDLLDPTVKYFPREATTATITRVMEELNYWQTLLNTTLLSVGVGLCQMLVAAVSGYGLARYKFKGRGLLFGLTIVTLMVPTQVTLIPLNLTFQNFFGINLLNTPVPLILLAITGQGIKNGLYIYLMRQFYRGLPKELEESAYIDGAGPLRCFIRVILPNAIPMLITVFLFSFTWQWTENVITPIFMPRSDIFARLMTMVAAASRDNPIMVSVLNNTSSLLVIIPILIVFFFLQRYFVEGMERSGIVG